MNINDHTTPEKLERYAFMWSIARMVIASVSLFFGAVPIALRIFDYQLGFFVQLAWLISGIASIYLGYMWYKNKKSIFGANHQNDTIFFLILVITGINLGYTITGYNFGMSFAYSLPLTWLIFKLTALGYLYVAYNLWKKWKAHDEHLFSKEEKVSASE